MTDLITARIFSPYMYYSFTMFYIRGEVCHMTKMELLTLLLVIISIIDLLLK